MRLTCSITPHSKSPHRGRVPGEPNDLLTDGGNPYNLDGDAEQVQAREAVEIAFTDAKDDMESEDMRSMLTWRDLIELKMRPEWKLR